MSGSETQITLHVNWPLLNCEFRQNPHALYLHEYDNDPNSVNTGPDDRQWLQLPIARQILGSPCNNSALLVLNGGTDTGENKASLIRSLFNPRSLTRKQLIIQKWQRYFGSPLRYDHIVDAARVDPIVEQVLGMNERLHLHTELFELDGHVERTRVWATL
jgi:hypothetical protein